MSIRNIGFNLGTPIGTLENGPDPIRAKLEQAFPTRHPRVTNWGNLPGGEFGPGGEYGGDPIEDPLGGPGLSDDGPPIGPHGPWIPRIDNNLEPDPIPPPPPPPYKRPADGKFPWGPVNLPTDGPILYDDSGSVGNFDYEIPKQVGRYNAPRFGNKEFTGDNGGCDDDAKAALNAQFNDIFGPNGHYYKKMAAGFPDQLWNCIVLIWNSISEIRCRDADRDSMEGGNKVIHEGDRTILQMNTKLLGDPVTMLMTLVEEGLKRCSSDSTPASRKLFDVFDFGRNVLYYDLEDANDVIGDAGCEELKKLKDQKIYTTQDRLVIVDRVGRVWKNPFYPDYPPAGYDPTKDTPEPHYIGHSFQIERCW